MTNLSRYIKTECIIDGIKTINDLTGAYFALWNLRRLKLYDRGVKDLEGKDRLREKLLEKMREVL